MTERFEQLFEQAPVAGPNEEVYVLPTSFAQQRLWFLDQFEPDSPFYNIPSGVRFKGRLDLKVLQDAVNEIIRRHETLRTTFEVVDEKPCQIVHDFKPRTLPLIDISDLPPTAREAQMIHLTRREAATPFNLRRGPLLRVTVIRLDVEDHVILFTMHHIISDGWSMGVFVREITALYDAFSKKRPSPLPPLAIQYGDFAEWQQQYIAGEVLENQLAYWKKRLGGTLPILELPSDRPRPAVQTMVGANYELIVGEEIARPFKEMSRSAGVTLFMSLLAAYQVLLHRYTALDDILVGSPIANRNRAEIEPLIGFFVNTLVLRADLSGNPTFTELLKQVKQRTLEAYDHQDIPFERLVEVLQPQRDMAHSPLFQVMFILQNTPANVDVELAEVKLESLSLDAGTSTFDLTLMVSEGNNAFSISAEYNTDIFDEATIARFVGHFENLLKELAADPERRISDYEFIDGAERRLLLDEWNAYDRDYPPELTVHGLFEAQVLRTPSAVAVAADNDYLTYDELNARANRLAAHLRSLGVGPEVKVNICMDKCLDLPAAVLAVLKAGGAYVPVDPTYPPERIAYMIEDSAAAVILTHEKHLPLLPPSGVVVCLDRDRALIERQKGDNPINRTDADHLAYMIYTSGSTGKAKGTMVSHRAFVNAYLAWEEDYRLRTDVNSHLQMASFSFDVFGGDFVRALLSGGKLVLAPRETLLEADKLYDLMRREKVNCAEFVPAVLRNLVNYLDETGQKLDFMTNLIAGSDVWYVKEYRKFLDYCGPQTRLINSFGLTEAAVDSTFFEGDVSAYAAERLVPIGRPFANTKIYIVDQYFNPTPIGVPGELLVAGPNLARGYFKRPDLTAEKFIPDPFSGRPGARLYRTGDLARRLADGNIEFLGRIDFQVKIRGFRVELGEIEAALEKYPGVKNAVVVMREDRPGDKRIVGYVTSLNGLLTQVSEMRAFLKESLPDYMVPAAIVSMEAFPLTPNGKIDRKALPPPDQSLLDAAAHFVEPETPTEQGIAHIWSDLLNLPRVGRDDNFFELGGHSLLATQVLSRLRQNFKVELPLRSLFEYVTVRDLAAAVDRAAGGEQAPPITPMPKDAEPLLSFAQERLWFLDQLEPDSPFYNIPDALRIKGELDVERLIACVNEVVRRHDVLRTTFGEQDGRPALHIAESLVIDCPQDDLRRLPAKEREKAVTQRAAEEARRPFNLTQAPLFRLRLLRLDEHEYVLLNTFHHIISDGWSSNVMIGEIAVLYDAFAHGLPSPLPPLPLQYQDFAYWQRNWLKGAVLNKELDFWKKNLAGAPALLNLPTDRPRPAVQTPNGDFMSFELSDELTAALHQISREQGVTLFMTLLAAFNVLLQRYAGQDDICVGTPTANRTRGELENLIGFFVNTLVLRTDLSGNPPFAELLQRVKQTALGAFSHQDVPFEKIVDVLQVERNLSHSPLFQVMFALQNTPDQQIETETKLNISPITAHSGTSKFDLTLFMVEEGATLSGGIEYNTDLFDAATIRRMMRHFTALLREIVADPTRALSTLPMISPHERKQLLLDWNGVDSPPVISDDAVTLFESVALTMRLIHPDHLALRCGDLRLSYRDLNRRANHLAHYLIEQGVKPDTLVGLSVPRSIDMVTAIFGILKAGGAYVPLDPSYPAERLAYMIEDSRVSVLVTNEATLERLPQTDCRIVCMDCDWPEIETLSDANPKIEHLPDQLAYMIYTSGSTGKPKGAMITHRGLSNYLDWVYKSYPIKSGRGSIVHSTVAFDATVTALFAPILAGKTITLLPDDADLEALAAMLKEKKDFSLVKITPAHLEMLSHQIRPEEAAGLTASFVIGGENLTAEQVEFWQQNAPETLLFNEYGPTETVVGCVVYEASEWRGSGSVPIGQCITNMRVYVLDERMELSPLGVPGELYIGGAGVARGYFNRPDLTAERFVPDPFSTEPGARLYKTGDLVRYLNNGKLIFLNRIDNQVKIRGYRIELGEIDAVLASHERINAVMTLVREDTPGDKRLVAYYVADEPLSAEALYELLRQKLPEYMIPAALVHLNEFPLTANGKVDRRALPRPDYGTAEGHEYVAPRTTQEEALANIWRDLLHVERLGVHDNFFQLGGHSLLATQLMSRVRTAFALELPLRALFEAPTVAQLARRIDAERLQQEGRGLPPLKPVPRDGELPLSFAQQRLWFLDQLAPGNAFYNIPMSIKITGELNVEAMERSITEIVRRHEALRTGFLNERGAPRQVIREPFAVTLPITDLSALPTEQAEQEMHRLITQDAMAPFNLDQPPLFRAGLIRLTERAHVLRFTVHHIISDGWSTNVLMSEFAALYDAFSHGRPSPLPQLRIQYADYAAWQRARLTDEVLAKQLRFWRKKIGVHPPVLDLPIDFPRPPQQTFHGDAVSITIPAELYERIKYLSQKSDATLFMTLLAAFQALLYRYTRQEEIIVGSPIANRNFAETEALIGFFVNTLVLRADLSRSMTFGELLAQVRDFTLDAYAHQDIPFEQLVDALEPTRDLSRSPLFQVMFVLQNTPRVAGMGSNMNIEVIEPDERAAKFDLTLVMAESFDGLMAELEYNTDLFARPTVERMLRHFARLLAEAVAHPHERIAAMRFIEPSERELAVHGWNRTTVAFPDHLCLHQAFEAQVAGTPDAHALFCNGERLTYAQLNARANRLAHLLIEEGVRPETVVAVCMERSPDLIVSLLAVLKAGGAYLPIDPNYPPERIAYILKNARTPLLLTDGALNVEGVTALIPAQLAEALEQMSIDNPQTTVTPDNLAYVIYTSGSTGLPKGTLLQHRGAVNMALQVAKVFDFTERTRKLQFASFSFDASVEEIFVTLLSGAELYVEHRQQILPGPDLIDYINRHQISQITLPPSALAVMSPAAVPSLHSVTSAGEACPLRIAETWSKDRLLINAYGPTEATVCATAFRVNALTKSGHLPIGAPLGNVRVYILDEAFEPMPVGVPGELCIAGIGLARGYWGRPDLTAEKFIPNPFDQGTRLYRTGDLARRLPDGNIEFLGRIDHQVKLRGFRIELGEIEQVLMRHSAVQQAVVLVQEVQGRKGDSRLTAYLVVDLDAPPAEHDLRDLCRSFLPDYMMPQVFIYLDALPLTPNGKVDRRALPLPSAEDVRGASEFVAPRTELETQIAGIWQEVLGVPEIGVYDNFFQAGGHSLLATQVVSRLRESLNLDVPVALIFEATTVAEMAEKLREFKSHETAPKLTPVSRDQELPLSFAQQRLWFLDQLEPGSPMYNLPAAVRLKGRLDLDAFRQSLHALTERHESLRTTFAAADGRPHQVIAAGGSEPLKIFDWRHLPIEEQQSKLDEFVANEFTTPFDLAVGPLFRTFLIRLKENESVFVMNMHHIISDGWSMNVFISDFAQFYAALSAGQTAALPELSIQYADYAYHQRQRLRGELLERHLDYWRRTLEGAPALLNLPTDRPRPAIQTYNGATESFEIDAAAIRRLQDLTRGHDATPFMTLLAAFQLLLHRYSGQDDIVVGTPIANRNSRETEALIGFFVNTLALRTEFNGDMTFRDLLKAVRQRALDAYEHQDVPFEMVVDAVQPERNMSHSPLFQVMFVLQNLPSQAHHPADFSIEPIEAETRLAKFDLTMTLTGRDQGYSGSLEYNTDLFDRRTALQIIRHFTNLLHNLAAAPDQPISRVPLLSAEERAAMTTICNIPQADFHDGRCIHERFEAQCALHPQAVAVTFEDKHLTYADLNRRANKLAHFLKRNHIGADDLVGLCVERSLEMIVGILGILKAGAGYVPIDPHYPNDRKSFILADSGMKMLLTQEHILSELQGVQTRTLCLDQDWRIVEYETGENLPKTAAPQNIAYIIYTSGSTGKPKGVMVTHENVTRLFHATNPWYHFNEKDVWTMFHSHAFDFSVWEIWGALLYGGRIVVVPYMVSRSPESFYELLAREKVTVLNQTPSAFRQLIQHEELNGVSELALRYVIFGGDKLELSSLKPWFERHGYARPLLINMYGITETTVHVTYRPLEKIDIETAPGSMIGGPIPDLQVYILDDSLEPMPVGVAGELYVGGAGVTRGYLYRPDLTAQKFIPDPFSPQPGRRLYRSGDLARFTANGDIEYLGRVDHQVQIRGFRVELGEIEAVLGSHPDIKETLVLLREDQPGDQKLVAYYVVPDEAAVIPVNDLRSLLKTKLPDYMIPAHFVRMTGFPLTSHGKIDRRALPLPEASRPDLAQEYVAPTTENEQQLADIWKSVLLVDRVGIYDNFFELGGDSILTIQVISRAAKAGLKLLPRHMFQTNNLKELAEVAEPLEADGRVEEKAVGPAPLTPIQHWFFEHHRSAPQQFNMSLLLELKRPLQLDALEQTLRRLIGRHDAFRLRFYKADGSWRQEFVDSVDDVPLEVVDLTALKKRHQKAAIEQKAAEVQETFDLSRPPLLRVVYLKLDANDARLLIVLHHLIADGVSWRFIMEDLANIYMQVLQNKPDEGYRSTSYKLWAEKLADYANSPELQQEASFWLEQVRPVENEPKLPVDFPNGLNTYGGVDHVTLSLSSEDTHVLLHELPKALGSQINDLLITALYRVLAAWTGQNVLRIEMEGHGREDVFADVDLSRTIGWFTSIFHLRLTVNSSDLAEQVREVSGQLARVPQRGFGFGVLKYLRRDPELEPLRTATEPEINFNYLGQFDQFDAEANLPFQMAPEVIRNEQHPQEGKGALLHVVASVSGRQMHLRWLYSKNIFKASTINSLAHSFVRELQSIVRLKNSVNG